MLYFISDTHLSHYNIIKYCDRPFTTINEMNQTIINNWNSVVNEQDIVFHLGDVAFKNSIFEILPQLKGHKWLLRGNHDRGYSDTKFREAGFSEIFSRPYSFVRFERGVPIYIRCMHAPKYFKDGYINLCGHVHNKWKNNYGYLNVGVDVWDFTPVSLRTVISYYRRIYPDIMFSRYPSRSFEEFTR